MKRWTDLWVTFFLAGLLAVLAATFITFHIVTGISRAGDDTFKIQDTIDMGMKWEQPPDLQFSIDGLDNVARVPGADLKNLSAEELTRLGAAIAIAGTGIIPAGDGSGRIVMEKLVPKRYWVNPKPKKGETDG